MKTVIVMAFAALAATQLTGCGGDDKDTAADTAGAPVDTARGGDTSDTSGGDTGGGAETGDTADTADTADSAVAQ